ncbi:MAG TPA: hypothetical protein VHN99_06970, partial [Deinococcales bacterium]|nr:hypothetical protein [Deinococcales bacterium]
GTGGGGGNGSGTSAGRGGTGSTGTGPGASDAGTGTGKGSGSATTGADKGEACAVVVDAEGLTPALYTDAYPLFVNAQNQRVWPTLEMMKAAPTAILEDYARFLPSLALAKQQAAELLKTQVGSGTYNSLVVTVKANRAGLSLSRPAANDSNVKPDIVLDRASLDKITALSNRLDNRVCHIFIAK